MLGALFPGLFCGIVALVFRRTSGRPGLMT